MMTFSKADAKALVSPKKAAAAEPPTPPPLIPIIPTRAVTHYSAEQQEAAKKATHRRTTIRESKEQIKASGDTADRYTASKSHRSVPFDAAIRDGKPVRAKPKTCMFCGLQTAMHYCGTCGVVLHGHTKTSAARNTSGKAWPCHDLWHDRARNLDHHGNGEAYTDWKKLSKKNRRAFSTPKELTEVKKQTQKYVNRIGSKKSK